MNASELKRVERVQRLNGSGIEMPSIYEILRYSLDPVAESNKSTPKGGVSSFFMKLESEYLLFQEEKSDNIFNVKPLNQVCCC